MSYIFLGLAGGARGRRSPQRRPKGPEDMGRKFWFIKYGEIEKFVMTFADIFDIWCMMYFYIKIYYH